MVKFVLSGFSDEIDKDLNIQISELKRNNINHMEIRGVYGKGIVEYTINEVKEIKKLLDSEGDVYKRQVIVIGRGSRLQSAIKLGCDDRCV